MSINSIQNLLDALGRTQLFSPDQVEEVRQELVPHFEDAHSLADYLVQIEWLTEYQSEMLFQEEWDHLVVGPYHILDLLGEGGISEVFKAWDTMAGQVVALKVLRPGLPCRSDAAEQLRHESEIMSQLAHPNVLRTFAAGDVDGIPYFAMEYVQGQDLERLVEEEGRLTVEQACDYIRQAAQALQHAHQLGLAHLDIKPANLFLVSSQAAGNGPGRIRSADPAIKVLDWGLARRVCAGERVEPAQPTSAAAPQGHLLGTPDYVSPEQAADPTLADIRSDIYSLGCTLYYLLAGKPPFPGPSLMQKLMQHRSEEPQPIQELRPDVPEDLAAILRRMMAKRPEDRFPIPLLLVAPLRRFSQGAAAAPGQLFRPGSSGVIRPSSTPSLASVRPGSSGVLSTNARPPSFPGIGGRPASNGGGSNPPR